METKNGFDVVFTINETPTFSDEEPPEADGAVEPELEPQAVRLSAPRVRTAPAAKRSGGR